MDTFQKASAIFVAVAMPLVVALMASTSWYMRELNRLRAGLPERRVPLWVRVIERAAFLKDGK